MQAVMVIEHGDAENYYILEIPWHAIYVSIESKASILVWLGIVHKWRVILVSLVTLLHANANASDRWHIVHDL